jgi:hypothetical protein
MDVGNVGLKSATPALLHGLRLWASVCLALYNAMRAFVAMGGVELLWVKTAWPNGAASLTFVAVGVTLFAPRADQAYASAMLSLISEPSQVAAFAGGRP